MENIFTFFEKNPYYVILIISAVIWTGITFYLYRIDHSISKLEKQGK